MKIHKTRKRPPYLTGGRTAFPHRGTPGVYLIFPIGADAPVYVGHGRDVYKPLYRHFQRWEDPSQVRVTYPKQGYAVRVVYTKTLEQAVKLERALILKHRPKDNPNKLTQYEISPAEERTVDAMDAAPFGSVPTEEAPF